MYSRGLRAGSGYKRSVKKESGNCKEVCVALKAQDVVTSNIGIGHSRPITVLAFNWRLARRLRSYSLKHPQGWVL